MLIESRIRPDVIVLIDCESVGGVDKSSIKVDTDPDRVFQNAERVIKMVADHLADAMDQAHADIDIEFAVRVNSAAVVFVAQRPEEGQFRVRMTRKLV